jgi:hypothetical protein
MRNGYPAVDLMLGWLVLWPTRDVDNDRPIRQPGDGAEELGFCRVGKGNERELHSRRGKPHMEERLGAGALLEAWRGDGPY